MNHEFTSILNVPLKLDKDAAIVFARVIRRILDQLDDAPGVFTRG